MGMKSIEFWFIVVGMCMRSLLPRGWRSIHGGLRNKVISVRISILFTIKSWGNPVSIWIRKSIQTHCVIGSRSLKPTQILPFWLLSLSRDSMKWKGICYRFCSKDRYYFIKTQDNFEDWVCIALRVLVLILQLEEQGRNQITLRQEDNRGANHPQGLKRITQQS